MKANTTVARVGIATFMVAVLGCRERCPDCTMENGGRPLTAEKAGILSDALSDTKTTVYCWIIEQDKWFAMSLEECGKLAALFAALEYVPVKNNVKRESVILVTTADKRYALNFFQGGFIETGQRMFLVRGGLSGVMQMLHDEYEVKKKKGELIGTPKFESAAREDS